jgi:hypothetical protein
MEKNREKKKCKNRGLQPRFLQQEKRRGKNEKEGLVKYLSILYPAFVKKKRG